MFGAKKKPVVERDEIVGSEDEEENQYDKSSEEEDKKTLPRPTQPQANVQLVEREINLSLINEKLNFLISQSDRIEKKLNSFK
jgi:hypothetical protein